MASENRAPARSPGERVSPIGVSPPALKQPILSCDADRRKNQRPKSRGGNCPGRRGRRPDAMAESRIAETPHKARTMADSAGGSCHKMSDGGSENDVGEGMGATTALWQYQRRAKAGSVGLWPISA